MKTRLYRSAVCSTISHSCKAWTLSSAVRKILYGLSSRRLSSITGEHRRETAINPDFDLLTAVVRRRLFFFGHILSMDDDRLLGRTLIAYMNTKTPYFVGA